MPAELIETIEETSGSTTSKYVPSDNIQLFPIASRGEKDPLGRLTTEYNLTSILNKLLDREGFVITKQSESGELIPGSLDFNIHGYLIHIKDITEITNQFNSNNNIYATIIISQPQEEAPVSSDDNTWYLNSGSGDVEVEDKDGNKVYQYQGVKFDASLPSDSNSFSLHILEKIDDKWRIPEESKLKFITSENGSSRSVAIDDGVLSTVSSTTN